MNSILPSGTGQKPEESLLHQGRRLHRVIPSFPGEVASRKSMQLRADQGEKIIEGRTVSLTPNRQ
jgi:hypothetical protein